MLKLKHLTKTYGNKTAVSDLSLEIAPGQICGFIGHNGAGKTTTLRAIAGIMEFDAGEIKVNGLDVAAQPLKAKRQMAYIPDNPDLYEFMTGIGYLSFVADIFGVKEKARRERIEEVAGRLELIDDLGEPILSYSHGMKQKLAICAAWVHDPALVLMDEPFVGLDPRASHILKEMMREKCGQGGAIFFSTHVLEVAEKLCDQIAIIRRGQLVISGSLKEVMGQESLEEVFLELEERKC